MNKSTEFFMHKGYELYIGKKIISQGSIADISLVMESYLIALQIDN
jgi:hypothetical protein